MVEILLLVEGTDVDMEALRRQSLRNAKQLLFGRFGHGEIVHLGMNSFDDLAGALTDLSGVTGVTSITTLALRR